MSRLNSSVMSSFMLAVFYLIPVLALADTEAECADPAASSINRIKIRGGISDPQPTVTDLVKSLTHPAPVTVNKTDSVLNRVVVRGGLSDPQTDINKVSISDPTAQLDEPISVWTKNPQPSVIAASIPVGNVFHVEHSAHFHKQHAVTTREQDVLDPTTPVLDPQRNVSLDLERNVTSLYHPVTTGGQDVLDSTTLVLDPQRNLLLDLERNVTSLYHHNGSLENVTSNGVWPKASVTSSSVLRLYSTTRKVSDIPVTSNASNLSLLGSAKFASMIPVNDVTFNDVTMSPSYNNVTSNVSSTRSALSLFTPQPPNASSGNVSVANSSNVPISGPISALPTQQPQSNVTNSVSFVGSSSPVSIQQVANASSVNVAVINSSNVSTAGPISSLPTQQPQSNVTNNVSAGSSSPVSTQVANASSGNVAVLNSSNVSTAGPISSLPTQQPASNITANVSSIILATASRSNPTSVTMLSMSTNSTTTVAIQPSINVTSCVITVQPGLETMLTNVIYERGLITLHFASGIGHVATLPTLPSNVTLVVERASSSLTTSIICSCPSSSIIIRPGNVIDMITTATVNDTLKIDLVCKEMSSFTSMLGAAVTNVTTSSSNVVYMRDMSGNRGISLPNVASLMGNVSAAVTSPSGAALKVISGVLLPNLTAPTNIASSAVTAPFGLQMPSTTNAASAGLLSNQEVVTPQLTSAVFPRNVTLPTSNTSSLITSPFGLQLESSAGAAFGSAMSSNLGSDVALPTASSTVTSHSHPNGMLPTVNAPSADVFVLSPETESLQTHRKLFAANVTSSNIATSANPEFGSSNINVLPLHNIIDSGMLAPSSENPSSKKLKVAAGNITSQFNESLSSDKERNINKTGLLFKPDRRQFEKKSWTGHAGDKRPKSKSLELQTTTVRPHSDVPVSEAGDKDNSLTVEDAVVLGDISEEANLKKLLSSSSKTANSTPDDLSDMSSDNLSQPEDSTTIGSTRRRPAIGKKRNITISSKSDRNNSKRGLKKRDAVEKSQSTKDLIREVLSALGFERKTSAPDSNSTMSTSAPDSNVKVPTSAPDSNVTGSNVTMSTSAPDSNATKPTSVSDSNVTKQASPFGSNVTTTASASGSNVTKPMKNINATSIPVSPSANISSDGLHQKLVIENATDSATLSSLQITINSTSKKPAKTSTKSDVLSSSGYSMTFSSAAPVLSTRTGIITPSNDSQQRGGVMTPNNDIKTPFSTAAPLSGGNGGVMTPNNDIQGFGGMMAPNNDVQGRGGKMTVNNDLQGHTEMATPNNDVQLLQQILGPSLTVASNGQIPTQQQFGKHRLYESHPEPGKLY